MVIRWFPLFFLLEGVQSTCNINHCDLDYCSGDGCIKCEDGYYLSGTYCLQCQPSCSTCTSSTSCTDCHRGWHGTTCDSKCRSECPDCVSFSQCRECIPGRHGSFCQFYCPLGCLNILCDKDSGQCTEGCRQGYYTNGEVCTQCPENCERCTGSSLCTDCKPGYFGPYCQSACPNSCLNQRCENIHGYCTDGCIEGYYLDENTCVTCPETCAACLDINTCTQCKTGYWGLQCRNDCPWDCIRCDQRGYCMDDPECNVNNCDGRYCVGNGCIKCEKGYYLTDVSCYECSSYCTECSGPSDCTRCARGRYGNMCENICRSTCIDCSDFTECTECIPGRYGSYCQFYCPLGCIDILCNKDTGKCTEGCRHGYYQSGEECNECPEHCTRCSDDRDCTECVPGYFGRYCQLECSFSCENSLCDKELGYCMEGCAEGYFDDGSNCVSCYSQCVSCVDAATCTECITGYWGPSCQYSCPITCGKCTKEGQCIFDSDCTVNDCDVDYCTESSCIKCDVGFYLSGTSCHQCPRHCTECSGPSTCTQCARGRYGSQCEIPCRKTCLDCVSDSQCTECIPGRYGQYCQLFCPLGCIDIVCDKISGECLDGCRHGYYNNGDYCSECPEHCTRCSDSNQCTGCVAGYYGTHCQSSCPTSCQEGLCDKERGFCTEGCIDGHFFENSYCFSCPHRCSSCVDINTCIDCKTGYWGLQCREDCPVTCLRCSNDGQCISDPTCRINNCDRDYCIENSCIKCEEGYYLLGTHCYDCPSRCTKCSDPTTCTECVRGRYGLECEYTCNTACTDCISSSQCTECIPGRHGTFCQFYCPLGCIDILCEKVSGKCTKGCRHGYYSSEDDCIKCPEHCAKCIDSVHCTGCASGYYGSICQQTCESRCLNQVCDKDFGNCTEGCEEGYYQSENNCFSCPDWCERCLDPNTCTKCKTGRWGPQCQHDCQGPCKDDIRTCDIDHCEKEFCLGSGCIKCEDGFYLSATHCYHCPEYCTQCSGPSSCSRCVRGRYGPQCEYTCSSLCPDCISSTECTECIPGRHGTTCQSYCPLSCNNILCNKDTGTCTDGCRRGFYPNEENCTPCPERCTTCSDSSHCNVCKPGYYGTYCQLTCPQGCEGEVCHKDTGYCTEGCIKGYYFNEYCLRCSDKCASCVDENNCDECKTGYWGIQCQNHCPDNCYSCNNQGQCIDESGPECYIDHCDKRYCFGNGCTKCKSGYYLYGTSCYQCPLDCIECSSASLCTQCIQGKYGTTCEYACENTCRACISSTQCTECIPGRHGSLCQLYCPLGCKDIMCYQSSGKCTEGCRNGYYPSDGYCVQCADQCTICTNNSYCITCRAGRYGSTCEQICHEGCSDGLCHVDTGNCTHGCSDGYHFHMGYCVEDVVDTECEIANCATDNCFGSLCTMCEDGYYLEDFQCHECPDHCKTCTSTTKCGECISGRHGSYCQFVCSPGCRNSTCSKDSGFCTEGCNDGYTMAGGECKSCPRNCSVCISMDLCTKCEIGFWGRICQYSCLGCSTVGCQQNVSCTNGCQEGYHVRIIDNESYECIPCPEACDSCSDSSTCTTCKTGHWGSTCTNTCSPNCKTAACTKDEGHCTKGCTNGYYGYTCSERCSSMCETCENGDRCNVCIAGRYGVMCEQQCSENCFRYVCTRHNGTCVYGCSIGYSGDTCEQEFRPSSCPQVGGSDNGASIGLGVVLAIAGIVIAGLVFLLVRRRYTRRKESEHAPAMMNKTYDTRIGTADFYSTEKDLGDPYDNSKKDMLPSKEVDTICRYPTPSNSDFDKNYDEETEYSIIRTSNDNIACF